MEKSLSAGLEVGNIILTAIGIECLSGYYAGKASGNNTFNEFIKKFMPTYSGHAEVIYKCFRNGLAHDYIIKEVEGKSFVFTRNIGEKHLSPVEGKSRWYYLNREAFVLDFIKAQKDFIELVDQSQELHKKALQRLKDRSFIDVFSFQSTTMFVDPDQYTEKYDSATGTVPKKL